MRVLQKIRRENPCAQFVFLSERSVPIIDSAFRKMLYRTGEVAKLGLPVYPHMLRRSCEFKLVNDWQRHQKYLSTRYTKYCTLCIIGPSKFKSFWKD